MREKKSKGTSQTVVKVRKVTGVDVTKGMIIAKLDKATKENFPSEILTEKVPSSLLRSLPFLPPHCTFLLLPRRLIPCLGSLVPAGNLRSSVLHLFMLLPYGERLL